ncbi:MAG: ATP-dependent Clp protease proteolytic subunit [Oscillospiraceae bacterium]
MRQELGTENEDRSEGQQAQNNCYNNGMIQKTKGKHPIHCLTIIGQVEGHFEANSQTKTTKYEHVIPQLIAVEEDPEIEGLLIILNTVGGDVEAGLAISELICGMTKPTASIVLGGGHSIGIPLAVAADRSFIVPTATMTIHPVRHSGTVLATMQTMNYLESIQDRIISFVVKNSKISKAKYTKFMMKTGELIMDVGTVLDGNQAVKEGLIDEIGYLSDALHFLNEQIEKTK